jgi:hypothetical protein
MCIWWPSAIGSVKAHLNYSSNPDIFAAEMAQNPRQKFAQFGARLQPAPPGQSLADFRIYASYRGFPGQFYGTLKVVRLTDNRVLFPFEGCPELGPFEDRQAALDSARQYGERLALGDLQNPE